MASLSRRSLLTAGLAGLGVALGAVSGARGAGADHVVADPEGFIEQLGIYAVEALTGPELPPEERERRFRAMLDQSFDIPTIGRVVLGRYWRTASDAEREEFLRLFEAFIVKSYAARFVEYSGERFQVHGTRQEKSHVIVHSTVFRPTGEAVRVDWRLRNGDGGFKVIDIIIEGVSMVVTQRADFASAIQSSGGRIAGLLDLLRRRTR